MTREEWLIIGLVGAAAAVLYLTRKTASPGAPVITGGITGTLQSGVENVQAALAGWKTVQQGPKWVPVLNAAEAQYGIPPDLLARIAYQESHFRPDIIDGTTVSSAGALGMMQLMPAYFQSVNVPRPFNEGDTLAQIDEAARELVRLQGVFHQWAVAVGAYNAGQGTMQAHLTQGSPLPTETALYIDQVMSDVPISA